ncbi:Pole [Symbiodinium sp. CCMP2592]|nr:Pole [Symbiodinium sp. CCMP2592]
MQALHVEARLLCERVTVITLTVINDEDEVALQMMTMTMTMRRYKCEHKNEDEEYNEDTVKIEDVENYEEVLQEVEQQLRDLCDPHKVAAQVGRMSAEYSSPFESPEKAAKRKKEEYNLQLVEYEITEGKGGVKSGGKKVKKSSYRVIKDDYPLIYHLDVGAMYPNIILSNRLQPMAIVTKEFCNSCTYNASSNNCQRSMDWKWRGDLYMATRADVRSIVNEMESDKRRYNHQDKETGETHRVKWSELKEGEQVAEITKAVRQFSQRAYKRLKSSVYEDRNDIVCQRENPFYVNTVLNFRDRRYMFKRKTKEWNKKLEKAEESRGPQWHLRGRILSWTASGLEGVRVVELQL